MVAVAFIQSLLITTQRRRLLTKSLEERNQYYGIAKIAGIKLLKLLEINIILIHRSLMPTNLYGPNDNYHPTNSHVIPSLIRKFIPSKINNLNSVSCFSIIII